MKFPCNVFSVFRVISVFVFITMMTPTKSFSTLDVESTSSPLSAKEPKANLPLAVSIVKKLRAITATHSSLQTKLQGEYRLNPIEISPWVVDFSIQALDSECVLVEGDGGFLSDKINLPYVSRSKDEFLDKTKAKTWTPGEIGPAALRQILLIGAPIPESFERVHVSWSDRNPKWFKLVFTYTEKYVHQEEILHIDPVSWRTISASLKDVDKGIILWNIEHQGMMVVRNEKDKTERVFPKETLMRFSFMSYSGQEKQRALKWVWKQIKWLEIPPRKDSTCRFHITKSGTANE